MSFRCIRSAGKRKFSTFQRTPFITTFFQYISAPDNQRWDPLHHLLLLPMAVFSKKPSARERYDGMASAFTSLAAVFTIETALILSLTILAFCALLYPFRIMRIELELQSDLEETSQAIALAMIPEDASSNLLSNYIPSAVLDLASSGINHVGALTYFLWLMNDDNIRYTDLEDISLSYSSIPDDSGFVDLVLTYKVKVPFINRTLSIVQRSRYYPMTGIHSLEDDDEDTDDSETMVYVTENGTVYHTSLSCSHLQLHVSAVSSSQLSTLRNQWGSKYRRCEKCGSTVLPSTVFIAQEGDCYHCQASCPGLTRNVKSVSQSEVSDLNECSLCASKEKSN